MIGSKCDQLNPDLGDPSRIRTDLRSGLAPIGITSTQTFFLGVESAPCAPARA